MNIVTSYNPLCHLWSAYDPDVADFAPDAEWPDNCVGTGETEQAAIENLREQME